MPPLNDPPSAPEPSGRAYWRSLDHLADTPEFRTFMHREFPAGASELLDSGERRHFLKIMGASMALAGLGVAGCRRWPDEVIVPFAHRPEGRVPGVQQYYATCWDMAGVAAPLVATCFDGRPTKIEGNEDHPASRGAASLLAQTSLLGLYDPDRSREVLKDSEAATWSAFASWASGHFTGNGQGVAVLSEATSSPSAEAMKRRFLAKFPQATWHEYEAINNDESLEGTRLAFLASYRTHVHLRQAKIIVTLDADLLGSHPNAVTHIRDFAHGRRVVDQSNDMNRLYAIEANLSLTGANADVRIAMKSADVAVAAAYLASRITGEADLAAVELDPAASGVLTPAVRAKLDAIVADLQHHPGECVIAVGAHQPAAVQTLAHLMNDRLGNVPNAVTYSPLRGAIPHRASIGELTAQMDAGAVNTLVILGGNPVYDAPSDLSFADRLSKVATRVHLSDSVNETTMRCTWHVNRAHYLEAWGDGRSWDGTYSIAQPMIMPLFDGKSSLELLATLIGEPTDGRTIVERTFGEIVGGGRPALWQQTLHDGHLPGSAATPSMPRTNPGNLSATVQGMVEGWRNGRAGWQVVFVPDSTVYDGRFANNGWCQELPDAITKLTWDNAALVSPHSARELGVDKGDMVTVDVGGRSIDIPILIVPGVADETVVLPLGYGRAIDSRIATGAGFDVYPLRTSTTMGYAGGGTVARTRGSYKLATTQDHHTVDVESVGGQSIQNRLGSLFREADLAEYRKHPDFAAHRTHVVHRLSLWEEDNLAGAQYRWGMTIDLNACVGCGACIAACQAENNIPIVGKDQVTRGREMHWLRVDRYFSFAEVGEDYDPNEMENVALQPVLCMMCENAPCEQVCPVAATVHDADGLNVMVYNRCIGTRYCSNNCPYKVRRFNYFDYHRRDAIRNSSGPLQVQPDYYLKKQATPDELLTLQFNPEVSVRMRGVMEKCTYCVQRISSAKIATKNAYANRSESDKKRMAGQRIEVPDGMITPACAQTCPAEAIVFGDLNDRKSRVTALQRSPRAYEMLEELNVDARTQYLAKVRNPIGGGSAGAHDSAAGTVEQAH